MSVPSVTGFGRKKLSVGEAAICVVVGPAGGFFVQIFEVLPRFFPLPPSTPLDYLPIMVSPAPNAANASRVIVEAPQVLKCGIRKDWLVREPMPSSLLEEILKAAEEEEAKLDWEVSRELTGDDSDEDIVLELKLDDELYEDI
ncbi:hypothetical protein M422DRAFT_259493 [Sphaerobolus stellatus SS14]|uniref:Uncharacterized protein n=1 Tax=Sphaerobolus stellatus (strain SS14) TaxID=990650 RepID=A0A0C9VJQ4_SPHS4|nr:hypothetical protein M422DRAFT_259493 [Sphaerobolus stellatus SS14]